MFKILIIEDDMTIAKTIAAHLKTWQYDTKVVSDFKAVVEEVVQYGPDLILLDVMLPYYNGFYWCQEIRKISQVPVVFVSSASDNMNIVMAMNMGGDDFIAKPFDLNVLTAKVQAVLRRSYSIKAAVNALEIKSVILNLNDTSLTFHGERLELTKNEYKILQILMEHGGKVVSRDDIMERLWESDSFIDDNTLTVNVTRLRKKLEDFGVIDYIKTKKGLGYMIET